MNLRTVARSRGALVCAIVLVQFVLFEAGLRLTSGSEAAPAFQKLFVQDPALGYRLAPGVSTRYTTREFDTAISINRAGVRDRECGAKAPGERRVVVLGDSLVMAVQVPLEQTVSYRLEERLNAGGAAGGAVRVINGGVQGYGPVEEYLFHRRVTSALAPDVVVMALYVANDAIEADISAAKLEAEHVAPSGETASPSGVSRPADGVGQPPFGERFTQWRRRVIRRSVVLQLVRLRVTTMLGRFGWAREVDPPLRIYLPAAPPEVARGLAVTRDAVLRLKALTEAQGARLVVMLLPARFQVEDGDYRRLKALMAEMDATLDRDKATTRFVEMLADTGIPVLDALPALRAAAHPDRLYFTSTAHFTAYGHDVLASALESFLRANTLLGPGPATAPPAPAGEGR